MSERLDALAEQIVTYSLRIDLATQAMLTYLREFDSLDGWEGSGFVSTATWLAWRTGISPSAAREHVAMHATAAEMERLAAAYRRTRVEPSQPNADMRRFARRSETRSGMVRIDIQLPPEQANVVWEAILAAMDAGRSEEGESASAEVRREVEVDPGLVEAERADALVSVAQAYLEHEQPRTLGSGYELVMMTSPEQLQKSPGGVAASCGTVRRFPNISLACSPATVRAWTSPPTNPARSSMSVAPGGRFPPQLAARRLPPRSFRPTILGWQARLALSWVLVRQPSERFSPAC